MKQLVTGLVLVVAGLAGVVAGPFHPGSGRFSTCAALHSVYPHGVALSLAAASTSEPMATHDHQARQVYLANRARLDPQGRGVACAD